MKSLAGACTGGTAKPTQNFDWVLPGSFALAKCQSIPTLPGMQIRALVLGGVLFAVVTAGMFVGTALVPRSGADQKLSALEERLDATNERLDGLAIQIRVASSRRGAQHVEGPTGEAEMGERLAALEVEVESQSEARSPASSGRSLNVPGLDTDALKSSLRDESVGESARIKSLALLRATAPEERAEVLEELLPLLDSDDDAIRADTARHLSGVTDPRLVAPLVQLLESDPSRKVREEAAETLGPLRNTREAKSALESAAQNDASDKVREQAKESLGG